MSRETAEYLRYLASQVKTGCIVEVGVFEGGSLDFIARGSRVPVYGVDTWGLVETTDPMDDDYNEQAYRIATRAMLKHPNTALIRGKSTEVAESWSHGEISLLFIDADHEYEAVKADYLAWQPHLAGKSVVAFDDYHWNAGVQMAVNELFGPQKVIAGRLAVIEFEGA